MKKMDDYYCLKKARKGAVRARKFPTNTCPASRHLFMIGEALSRKRGRANIEECWEPEHMASTIFSVCKSLWEARSRLESLGGSDRAWVKH